MTRQNKIKRIENKGWKITFAMSGNYVFASNGLLNLKSTSITGLHKKIFGY